MKVLIVLLGCVAYAAADCSPLQRIKVKHQWSEVYGDSADIREGLGNEIWGNMFHDDPAARDKFPDVRGDNIYSPAFQAHSVRVLGGLDMCISLLNNEDTLNAQLAHLNGQHKERGIGAEYFNAFEGVLLGAVAGHVHGYDQDAWQSCYRVISSGILA